MIPENISLSGDDEISGRFKKKFAKIAKKAVKYGTKAGMIYATGGTSILAQSALKKDLISGVNDAYISGDMIGKSLAKKLKKTVKTAAKATAKVATSTPAKYLAVAAAAAGTGFVAAKYGSTIKNAIVKKVSSVMAPAAATAEKETTDPVVNIPSVQSSAKDETDRNAYFDNATKVIKDTKEKQEQQERDAAFDFMTNKVLDEKTKEETGETVPSERANNAALMRTVADDTTPATTPPAGKSGGLGKIIPFVLILGAGIAIVKAGSGKGKARK